MKNNIQGHIIENQDSFEIRQIKAQIKICCDSGYWWARVKLNEQQINKIIETIWDDKNYKSYLDNLIIASVHWELEIPNTIDNTVEEVKTITQRIAEMWWMVWPSTWWNYKHRYL